MSSVIVSLRGVSNREKTIHRSDDIGDVSHSRISCRLVPCLSKACASLESAGEKKKDEK